MNLPKLVLASIAAAGAAAVAAGAAVAITQTSGSSAPPSDKMEWLSKAAPWMPAAATPVKTPCLECGQG